MTKRISQFGIEITLLIIRFTVKAVPPDYCLYKLNTSDCQGTPTPVFSYYKPGSRCEIEIWRGCPTYNKFDNEYLCSHSCIYNVIKPSITTAMASDLSADQCTHTVTQSCDSGPQRIAYTFNVEKKECLPLNWGDCKANNIFQDKDKCVDACLDDWKMELTNLTETDFADIDDVLSKFITPNPTAKKLKLMKYNNNTSPMTPLATKDETTSEVTTIETKGTEGVTILQETESSKVTEVATEAITEKVTTVIVTEKPTTDEVTTEIITETPTTDKITSEVTTEIVLANTATEEITTEVTTEIVIANTATQEITTQVTTEATVKTTVPRRTRTYRTMGTDYVSEVQLPD